MSILELNDLCVNYGEVKALQGISLTINEGEIVTLLGANGAGKTSTLQAISGTIEAQSGTILFAGQDIRKMPAHQRVENGLAHSPEGRRIFPDLTVFENLDMGAYALGDKGDYAELLDKVYDYFPILKERGKQKGGTLSGGEQQMLSVGRALMSKPRLLMLDEPSLGLAPLIVDKIFDIIKQINEDENVSIFLVEQNANEALQYAHRAYIIENGKIHISGDASDLLNDERVKEAYLGS